MRIVAGTHRGRRIEAPADARIRPTADRVREALFNSLGHFLGGFAGCRVLDAFAGTGALGLEALSRGAAHATFFDQDRGALDLCRRNIAALGLADRSRPQAADATRPPAATEPADLVFLDPPYGKGLGGLGMAALTDAGWIGRDTLIVLESDRSRPDPLPPGFAAIEQRDYGRTRIAFLRFNGVSPEGAAL